jgi:hypothetical protein
MPAADRSLSRNKSESSWVLAFTTVGGSKVCHFGISGVSLHAAGANFTIEGPVGEEELERLFRVIHDEPAPDWRFLLSSRAPRWEQDLVRWRISNEEARV